MLNTPSLRKQRKLGQFDNNDLPGRNIEKKFMELGYWMCIWIGGVFVFCLIVFLIMRIK